jgi:hypothetical protein
MSLESNINFVRQSKLTPFAGWMAGSLGGMEEIYSAKSGNYHGALRIAINPPC